MDELDFAVKYPFSKVAKKLLDSIELTDSIILKSIDRIKSALAGKKQSSFSVHREEKLEDIASFAGSRMALGHLRNRYITNKFAVAESKKASHHLSSENQEGFDWLCSEFSITIKDGRLIAIPAYLKNSPRSIDYKLINRNIINGFVEVNKREAVRLLEEGIRKRIENTPLAKEIPKAMEDGLKELIKEIPKFEPQVSMSFKDGDNPPCIERLLDSLKKHSNLNHQSRWGLAVYLNNRGLSVEKITELYSNLPDFDEKITGYQVEHIKKKGYTMPSCATMLTYGLCCADCKIGNPLNWRVKK